MTNKEAIEILTYMKNAYGKKPNQALDLAIKALEEYPTDKEIQDDMRRTYLGSKE